jgi:phosphoribosylglycinamide formyltransferase-1
VVAVGADRDGIEGLVRAEKAAVPTFVRKVADSATRAEWDRTLTETVAAFEPDLVVLAGFMRLVGSDFLGRFAGRVVNTHPALCPAFPGTSGPADALAYGVKVTGATLFVVDEGVDTGPIIAQTVVPVEDADDVESLHERIKVAERTMLVGTVGKLAREGFTITDRKVRIGT